MAEVNWQALSAPFAPEDIEWRIQQSGMKGDKPWAMVLAYIENRAIQQRLDDVLGPSLWRNEFDKAPDGGVMCGLSIWANGGWVTKWDGAENTDVEAVKGGLSNSMKRAAVQWGIGRYLYKLEATFVEVTSTKGAHYLDIKDKSKQSLFKGYWNDPKLPDWALPEVAVKKPTKPSTQHEPSPSRAEIPPTRPDKLRAPNNVADLTDSDKVLEIMSDHAPTEKQIERIRDLRGQLGYSEASVAARIKLLKTSGQAGSLIAKMKKEIEARKEED